MLNFIKKNWERVFFGIVGVGFLLLTFRYLFSDSITAASATFVMSFLCFVYSNLARFKRFKGLGFEAELWEDKQKEAANLIERLESVVTIYTREILIGRVMQSRLGNNDWKSYWDLYDELVAQHNALGQEIDFADLKGWMDAIFVFDMISKVMDGITKPIRDGKTDAHKKISTKFGTPIVDNEGYLSKTNELNKVRDRIDDAFKVSHEGNLAEESLRLMTESKRILEEEFDVLIEFDAALIADLKMISKLRNNGDIEVTDQLITLANTAGE